MLIHTLAFGQTINSKFLVTPSSPEAANLGRYGTVPVSYYSGTPQISIPLGEVSSGSIKVPISLSYNSSGNRVADMASWVGEGWALNAGGIITRLMRGKPDELSFGAGQSYFDFTPKQLAGGTVTNAFDLHDISIGCIEVVQLRWTV